MTATAYRNESKICPVCRQRFHRRSTASPSSFRSQITCSRTCGNVHAADPQAHPPRPEPDVRPPDADTRWRDQAACRGHDPDRWFPIGTSGPAVVQIAEAKAVCRGCPARAACLSWAVETGQNDGIWGGLDEFERRALKRRNVRTRARSA